MQEVGRHDKSIMNRYSKSRELWLDKKTSTSEILQMYLFMAILTF